MKKILIIEDDKVIVKALLTKLKVNGLSVISASNGLDGLSLAKKEKPDLILLDLVMPKMGGIEMLTELRKDTWGKDAEVIVLTVVNELDKIEKIISLGCFEYLIKTDWNLDNIVQKIINRIKD